MIEYLLVLLAQFFCVFLLGLNSKLMRDDKWQGAMFVAIFISFSQFAFIYIVANADSPAWVLFYSTIGGSLGIGFSHFFYLHGRKWCRNIIHLFKGKQHGKETKSS